MELKATQFLSMNKNDKVLWLSQLMVAVTMIARETYDVGSHGLAEPERLRRYNELLHRVGCQQVKVIKDDPGRMPDSLFLKILEASMCELNLKVERLFKVMHWS